MRFAENIWLGATATQVGLSHIMNYSAAFYGTAALQAWKLGVDAPAAFWQAIARVNESPVARAEAPAPVVTKPQPAAVAEKAVVDLVPPAKVAKAPAAPKTTPAPKTAPKAAIKTVAKPSAKPAAKPMAAKAKAAKPKAKASKAAAPSPAVINVNPHLLDGPRSGKADDLTVMSGVGDKLARVMNDFGIYHFDQIAGLNDDGIDWLNSQQPGFKAVIKRFDLVSQAKDLVS